MENNVQYTLQSFARQGARSDLDTPPRHKAIEYSYVDLLNSWVAAAE